MAISHGGVSFTGGAGVFELAPAQQPLQTLSAPGAYGQSLLVGPIMGREISCRYWLYGFESATSISSTIKTMETYKGVLTGTLNRDGSAADSFENCIFLGFVAEGPARYSAGGTVGWMQSGRLHWLQLKV